MEETQKILTNLVNRCLTKKQLCSALNIQFSLLYHYLNKYELKETQEENEKLVNKILDLVSQNKTSEQIAGILNMNVFMFKNKLFQINQNIKNYKEQMRNYSEWTTEQTDTLLKMKREKKTNKEIVAATGHSYSSVTSKMRDIRKKNKKNTITKPVMKKYQKSNFTQEQNEEIIAMRKAGKTFPEIGKKFGRKDGTMWAYYQTLVKNTPNTETLPVNEDTPNTVISTPVKRRRVHRTIEKNTKTPNRSDVSLKKELYDQFVSKQVKPEEVKPQVNISVQPTIYNDVTLEVIQELLKSGRKGIILL